VFYQGNKINMGLKNFLQKQGFIEEEDPAKENTGKKTSSEKNTKTETPVFFPIQQKPEASTDPEDGADPSFVTPLQKAETRGEKVDPNFIKFFEDELVKANLDGPDYFEFRQQLIKTQQKMSAKGMAAPDVVLQAVVTSFEAQGVNTDKLVQAALHYKDVIKQKNADFIRGAETEKNNQLQKRQNALQAHADKIQKLELQIQQLESQKQQLMDSLNKEKTQQEVDKSFGKEGIEKIDKAERLINTAHDYMQSTIDSDIKRLKSV
jgi:hypothetical protein